MLVRVPGDGISDFDTRCEEHTSTCSMRNVYSAADNRAATFESVHPTERHQEWYVNTGTGDMSRRSLSSRIRRSVHISVT